jgi:ribonuclease P protein component
LSTGRSRADSYLVLKLIGGTGAPSRIGLVTSKKVGGAVERNRVRRRLREIIKTMNIKCGTDLVFVARSSAGSANFPALQGSVRDLLKRAGLVDIENEKISA